MSVIPAVALAALAGVGGPAGVPAAALDVFSEAGDPPVALFASLLVPVVDLSAVVELGLRPGVVGARFPLGETLAFREDFTDAGPRMGCSWKFSASAGEAVRPCAHALVPVPDIPIHNMNRPRRVQVEQVIRQTLFVKI